MERSPTTFGSASGAGSVHALAIVPPVQHWGEDLFFKCQFMLHLLQEAPLPSCSWPFVNRVESFFL